jgi:exonuclease III
MKEIQLTDLSCIQVTFPCYTFVCIYRSPSNTNANKFIDSLSTYLDNIKAHQNIVITGDINININTTDKTKEYSHERCNRLAYLNMC